MNTNLNWNDLENIVAASVKELYNQLDDTTKISFLTDLQKASDELWKLSKGFNVDYDLRRMGEAYALYYHMRNAERIYIALDQITQKLSLPSQMKILDIGSGTCSGAMAVLFWMYQKHWGRLENAKLDFALVEKASPMREVANYILDVLRSHLNLTENEFIWNHRINDLLSASRLPSDRKFDLIRFAYTFWYQDHTQWDNPKRYVLNIAKHLNPGGIILFLTPTKKIDFINSLKNELLNCQMKTIRLDIDNLDIAPNQNPEPITQMRKFFEEQCRATSLSNIFIAGKPPYYGFPSQCDIFSWDSIQLTNSSNSGMLIREYA